MSLLKRLATTKQPSSPMPDTGGLQLLLTAIDKDKVSSFVVPGTVEFRNTLSDSRGPVPYYFGQMPWPGLVYQVPHDYRSAHLATPPFQGPGPPYFAAAPQGSSYTPNHFPASFSEKPRKKPSATPPVFSKITEKDGQINKVINLQNIKFTQVRDGILSVMESGQKYTLATLMEMYHKHLEEKNADTRKVSKAIFGRILSFLKAYIICSQDKSLHRNYYEKKTPPKLELSEDHKKLIAKIHSGQDFEISGLATACLMYRIEVKNLIYELAVEGSIEKSGSNCYKYIGPSIEALNSSPK